MAPTDSAEGVLEMLIKVMKGVFTISLSVLLLLLSVQAVSNYPYLSLHINRYESHRLVTWDHEFALREISAYLNGQRDDLAFPSQPGGSDVLMTERGLLHMEDVQVLYDRGRVLAAFFTVTAAVAGVTLYDKKQLKPVLKRLWILPLSVTAFLTIAMVIDFGAAFRLFHELLFDNDLWILSITDPLIVMLPRTFFFLTGLTIVIVYVSLIGLVTVLGYKVKADF
jgi:integral membrane protein (TIGR01906 family)